MMDSTNVRLPRDSIRPGSYPDGQRFGLQDPDISPGDGPRLLKRDPFGAISACTNPQGKLVIQRDTQAAAWWARWLARRLAAREARALTRAARVAGIPRLVAFDGRTLTRTWIGGLPMFQAQPREPRYYREALRLLRQLHRAGVVHNDLAKEPNWLCAADGAPGVIDFQLASVSARRGPLFRMLAREDLRHLLKHKRTYCPDRLTTRQRDMLARPAWPSRWSRRLLKPVYLTITRRWMGWEDRDGATDRQHP